MFAEVKHTNWDLEWSMHTSILKWLISQLKPLNLIVKNQRNAIYGSTVHQFQGRYPTPHQPLQPLKAPQKNTQDLLSRAGTQWLGCSKEKAVELQLLVPSDSRHLQHPSKHWGALAVSHGQLLSGGLSRDNSGFHTEMPTEGHWCRKLEPHEAPWPPPRGARPRSLLAPWESGKWQSASPKSSKSASRQQQQGSRDVPSLSPVWSVT